MKYVKVLYETSRDDKLMVNGKMYVYNEEEGKVVQFKRLGDVGANNSGSRWHSLDSLESR